jgi:hypothetical protein
MEAADPTGTTKIVGVGVVPVIGVGAVTDCVWLRVADPEVMTVVKRVAMAAVRCVVVRM